LIFLVACTVTLGAAAQTPLTLPQAVAIALEKNPLRKAAAAEHSASAAGVREARSLLLPRLMFSEIGMRGNDPVYVFGTRLRQQRFTTSDFALNRLNTPTPLGNFVTRFSGNWNLFDAQNYLGIRRAKAMNDAAGQQLQRTDQELILRTLEAYYGLLLAAKQQQVAEQAAQTAEAILGRSKGRYESGLVVESDLLSAQVNHAARRRELIQAVNGVSLAQARLNNVLGLTTITAYQPAETLAEESFAAAPIAELETKALQQRPDLARARLEESAQRNSAAMAKAAFAPRLNLFAQWELDHPTLFAGGGGNNWTGGLELQFDLFQGGGKAARAAREEALRQRAEAMVLSEENAVRLEVRRAYYDADAAQQQVAVARAAVAQAEESLRINQNRYESGLSTITDLLRVEEATRRARTDYWEAVYRYRTSYANLELATGSLNPNSPVVTQ
jgi:outer membrane protein TolC